MSKIAMCVYFGFFKIKKPSCGNKVIDIELKISWPSKKIIQMISSNLNIPETTIIFRDTTKWRDR